MEEVLALFVDTSPSVGGSASLTQATVKAFMSMTDPGGSIMFAQIGVMQDWIEPSSRSRTLIYEPACRWPEIST
jgi:hypothetical protein